jgi:multidrug efflux system membrane fusion protein
MVTREVKQTAGRERRGIRQIDVGNIISPSTIYLTGVGTVIAYNTDIVRAQIQGQIISINFTEGQTVHAGDLRLYQALVEQYTANLARDQAQLVNAQANLKRYSSLGHQGWATPQLVETQNAQVGELVAATKADQALIDSAKVALSYTRLTGGLALS